MKHKYFLTVLNYFSRYLNSIHWKNMPVSFMLKSLCFTLDSLFYSISTLGSLLGTFSVQRIMYIKNSIILLLKILLKHPKIAYWSKLLYFPILSTKL